MRSFILIILVYIVSVMPCYSQDNKKIINIINNAASQLKTMQCDFTQTKQIKLLNDKMISKGKMYYQQNNKLRWEYVSPYKYIFILNGDKVMLNNNNRNDVIDVNQNKVFKEIARIMVNSVVGNCLSDDKNFKINISVKEKEYTATLQPKRKNMKAMFSNIVLHFNKEMAVVSEVDLLENNGDKTTIVLENIKKNEGIKSGTFIIH